mgnify:CR=1 FL=1
MLAHEDQQSGNLGAVEEHLHEGRKDLAHAQVVQGMKAVHQFSIDGTWRSAWPLTYLADPIEKRKYGCNEIEREAILAFLKSQYVFAVSECPRVGIVSA